MYLISVRVPLVFDKVKFFSRVVHASARQHQKGFVGIAWAMKEHPINSLFARMVFVDVYRHVIVFWDAKESSSIPLKVLLAFSKELPVQLIYRAQFIDRAEPQHLFAHQINTQCFLHSHGII